MFERGGWDTSDWVRRQPAGPWAWMGLGAWLLSMVAGLWPWSWTWLWALSGTLFFGPWLLWWVWHRVWVPSVGGGHGKLVATPAVGKPTDRDAQTRESRDALALCQKSFAWGLAHAKPLKRWLVVGWLFLCWAVMRQQAPLPPLAEWVQTLGDGRQLVAVRGVVVSEPEVLPPSEGAMAAFDFNRPKTRFVLAVDALETNQGWVPTRGKLIVGAKGVLTGSHVLAHETKVLSANHDAVPANMGNQVLAPAVWMPQPIRVQTPVVVTGWLSALQPPMNPGGVDARAWFWRQGIVGRLDTADDGGAMVVLDGSMHAMGHGIATTPDGLYPKDAKTKDGQPAAAGAIGPPALSVSPVSKAWHRWQQNAAGHLAHGVQDPTHWALIKRLVLGQDVGPGLGAADPEQRFRGVGLAHVMSISGAHVLVVVSVVGWSLKRVCHRPRWATVGLFVAVLLFVSVVPLRVPVIRAGIMALALFATWTAGRRLGLLDRVGLAAVLVLLWRPDEWAQPGFQLSFLVVAALACWAAPLADAMAIRGAGWGRLLFASIQSRRDETMAEPIDGHDGGVALLPVWWLTVCQWVAVSVVAFAAAWPLTAYHFGQLHPWTALASLLALPLVGLLMTVAVLAMVLGAWMPSFAGVLSWALAASARLLLGLVDGLARLPGVEVNLADRPSVWWLCVMLFAVGLVGWGMVKDGKRSKRLGVACGVLATAWLVAWGGRVGVDTHPWPNGPVGKNKAFHQDTGEPSAKPFDFQTPPTGGMHLTALSVGNGSAWVIQTAGHAMLFDCGSQQNVDVGQTVAQALVAMGINRLDAVFLSHADADHHVGLLDLVDAMPVDAIWTPQQTWAHAEPGSALHALQEGLKTRQVPVLAVQQGWAWAIDGTHVEAVWPPKAWLSEADNDNSLVLKLTPATGTAMLFGDLQSEGLAGLQASGVSLQVDVAEAPHHGANNALTSEWMRAVQPKHIVQSCGVVRLQPNRDTWLQRMNDTPDVALGTRRWATAACGAVTVVFPEQGGGGLVIKTQRHPEDTWESPQR